MLQLTKNMTFDWMLLVVYSMSSDMSTTTIMTEDVFLPW